MSLTLILMRHAKSSWTTPGLADHDRPLNNRGFRSATALGEWMWDADLRPDQVFCSSATRTLQTFAGLGLDIEATSVPQLYHAGPQTMLTVLQSATGQCVLMVGHNPGICAFAHDLVGRAPRHDRFFDYPTGATLVVRFDATDWSNITPRSGVVIDFVIPRELIPE